MTVIDASEIARKAATYIREHGLAKNDLLFSDGSACFNGAVLIALAPDDYTLPSNSLELWRITGSSSIGFPGAVSGARDCFDRITAAASEILIDSYKLHSTLGSPVLFNNRHDTTAESVSALLDKVAERLAHA